MINSIILTGRLTADPEVVVKGEKKKATFNLAVDRGYKDEQGNKVTDFFYITTWNGTAELLSQYCRKGDLIGVEGSLRTFKKQNGDKNETHIQVIANRITFLAKKKAGEVSGPSAAEEDDDDLPI